MTSRGVGVADAPGLGHERPGSGGCVRLSSGLLIAKDALLQITLDVHPQVPLILSIFHLSQEEVLTPADSEQCALPTARIPGKWLLKGSLTSEITS